MKFAGALIAIAVCMGAEDAELTRSVLSIQDAIQSGDLTQASTLIKDSLARYPGDGGLINLRGIVHARRDEMPEAREDFAEAVRRAPTLTAAWQNLGRACQLEAQQDLSFSACAIDSWQHVLRVTAGHAEAHASLALLYEKTGKFAASLREIGTLSRTEASQPQNQLLRCVDLSEAGRIAEAKQAASLLASRGDYSESDLEPLNEALRSPKSAAVAAILIEALDTRHAASSASLRMLAVSYEQLQRSADARRILERVAVLDPKNTADLLELARLADASKNYEGALGYLAHARDLDPGNAQIHFLFAMIAVEMKLPIEARRALEQALALDPGNPGYNYAMGAVILTTRDAATASNYFQKFVSAKPADPRGHYALGIAYFASGDYVKAKQEMQSVEDEPKTAAGAHYFLGRMARSEEDLTGATRHLRKSIDLLPTYSESHTELARVFLEQQNIAGARTELQRALRLDPNSFQANAQLLVIYKRTGDARSDKQAELLKKLDEDRSKRAELMLRTVEFRP